VPGIELALDIKNIGWVRTSSANALRPLRMMAYNEVCRCRLKDLLYTYRLEIEGNQNANSL